MHMKRCLVSSYIIKKMQIKAKWYQQTFKLYNFLNFHLPCLFQANVSLGSEILLQENKLTCTCFMDVGKRHKTPGSEKRQQEALLCLQQLAFHTKFHGDDTDYTSREQCYNELRNPRIS